MPSGRTIWPSLPNAVLSFLMLLGLSGGFTRWITPPSFAITLIPYTLPKPRIQDLFQQLSRAFFLPSPSQVASDGECPRATSMQPTTLVKESNRH